MNKIYYVLIAAFLTACVPFNPGQIPQGWSVLEQTSSATTYIRTSQFAPVNDQIKADILVYNRSGGTPGVITLNKESCNDRAGFFEADMTGRPTPVKIAFKLEGTQQIDRTALLLCSKFGVSN